MNAISLFTTQGAELAKNTELVGVLTFKQSESGRARVGLLAASSKDPAAVTMKTVSGLKGQALKAFKRRNQVALMQAMAKEHAAVTTSGAYGGREMAVSKSGAVTFTYQPLKGDTTDTAAVVAKDAKIAELEAKLKAFTELLNSAKA